MPPTAIYLQKACLQHRYIRTRDNSHIVERPERLRAVNVGLAASIARLEERAPTSSSAGEPSALPTKADEDSDELTKALGKLQLSTPSHSTPSHSETLARVPVTFVHSGASVDILNDAAVKFVHGDIERDVYLENLKKWTQESQDKVEKGGSEVPEGYSQGDLYLCPGSLDAIQGALGTVCEAVDDVLKGSRATTADGGGAPSQAFVAVRPPGHHCGEDTPSGFCFVNNVAVGAAHAHLKHNVNRVVIFDIDLHHGNGTQAIAWQINEETYRKQLEAESGAPAGKPGLQVYYGSIHDILSYPCEDGKADLVQAASVSIHGPHGQHIENIHLTPYQSEQEFWDTLYPGSYSRLLEKAGDFLDSTGGAGNDVLVFISCGFDACEHEYSSMQRHKRKVPTSFYHRFAMDARAFARRYADGRLISVLEGGYSDRALTSGAMAHLSGLLEEDDLKADPAWWSVENLTALEAATKKRRGGRPSQTASPAPWLARTVELFASIDTSHNIPAAPRAPIPASNRTLRERKPANGSNRTSPATSPGKKSAASKARPSVAATSASEESDLTDASTSSEREGSAPKKLPRVILKLGPAPASGS
ncbi:Arginase/deacetylase [Lentinus brumalis]|uniref:Arginase/deacetylase n=1 Tax=Lentinus brumalis TaxID=2498619 RepID=A0A371DLP1_9APHY|nr:Arginase/deacetylase [Polyporus brumalis]